MLPSYKYKYPFLTSLMSAMDFCGRCKKRRSNNLRLKAALRVVVLSFKRPKVVDFLMEIRCVPTYS